MASILVASIFIIATLAYAISTYGVENRYTGKITNITYYHKDLDSVTKINFDGGKTLTFQGHLTFTAGETYTFSYREYGVLWSWLGHPTPLVLDSATPEPLTGG